MISGQDANLSQDIVEHSETSTNSQLLSHDVKKLIWLTTTKDQIINTQHVLKHYVETAEPFTNSAVIKKKGQLVKDFMQLCHLHKWIEPAESIWEDKGFLNLAGFIDNEAKCMGTNMPTVALCYLDTLYNNKMYQKVIDEVQQLEAEDIAQFPVFIHILGMMACMRLNTKASLDAATAFYNGKHGEQIMKVSRVVQPYALLLCQQGNPGLAFEVMSLLQTRHFNYLRTGILVYLLSALDRAEESCALLESALRFGEREDKAKSVARGQDVPKVIFSIESVKALTNLVESRKDVKLNARLAGVFSRLDKVASITDRNMVDLVAAEIDATSREKSRLSKEAKYLEKIYLTKGSTNESEMLADDEYSLKDKQHR